MQNITTLSKKLLILIFLFSASWAQSQKVKKEDKRLLANLQQHIHYLADDKLEGRRTGTPGEKLAAEYISAEFKKIGLQPKGTSEFYQRFEINEGKEISPETYLTIDGKNLLLHKDFFPMAYSPNIAIKASPSIALQEKDMPWFYNLKEALEENTANPHFDISETVMNKAREANKKGATALFIYNTSLIKDGLQFNSRDKSEMLPLPVIYISKEIAEKHLGDELATLGITLNTAIADKKRYGTNVIGFIDNNAVITVVLGAHYDHLGYGEDHNSMEVQKKHQIHNGADDNASGTAALMELARMLKTKKLKNNNYLFIAFSGEEQGLYGSKYFTEHPSVDLNKVNYMINMDMVGRLNDASHTVTVGGYGTSPSWGLLYAQKGKKKVYTGDLVFRYDSSGTGPSDHTSFYLKNIPVLFYFTGLHTDYHKPTDDFDKINYAGEMILVKHIFSLLHQENKERTKLVFTKTKESQTAATTRFSVTMGIMPDYTFNGAGVRVDGVSENKPAQKAGLQTGDIIISLGDLKTTSMETYMQALGKFKKGDKTNVAYMRNGKTFFASVEF